MGIVHIELVGITAPVGGVGPTKRGRYARTCSGLGRKIRGKCAKYGGNCSGQSARGSIAVRDIEGVAVADGRAGAIQIERNLETLVAAASRPPTDGDINRGDQIRAGD